MNTNQTIDGVPGLRSLLVRLLNSAEWQKLDFDRSDSPFRAKIASTISELRSLLNAPVVQHREVDGEHCPNPECCAWIAPNSECTQCNKAAQPQASRWRGK